jgi:succinate dehydrogenase/fumarate reductase flavoprotein subunit
MSSLPAEVDLVVVGAGLAGLAGAVVAVEAGARVLVLEKSARPGGSAALSSGIFWTAPDVETLRREVPLGDAAVGSAVVQEFPAAIEAVRAWGVDVTERFGPVMEFGVGHKVDIAAWLARAERTAGERLICGASVTSLLQEDQGVVGVAVRLPAAQGALQVVRSGAVLLATGGFQGARDLLSAYVGPGSDRLLARSNPGSVGDGLRLGLEAGAAASGGLAGFYGHLVPSPLRRFGPEDFLPLTQYHSRHCLLVNRLGRRFCNETLGDDRNNQALLRQPEGRGVIIFDEAVRSAHVVTPAIPHTEAIDRLSAARQAGARYSSAADLEALVQALARWGIPAANLLATLREYQAASEGRPGLLDAPVGAGASPLRQPPFHALEVQPSITFTHGGLRVDADGRVLERDGSPLAGLYAAGADAGGMSNEAYAGGLAPAFIQGRRAARAALSALDLGGGKIGP